MRKPIVAGNWKMNKTAAESRELVSTLLSPLMGITDVERVLCPPFPSLFAVSSMLDGSGIGLGAQNMHWEDKGAFTGEVSPGMVKELCSYVIIGHSERRTYFGETDATVNRKLHAALKHGLTPIVCVGETLEEYESGRTSEVVLRQINLRSQYSGSMMAWTTSLRGFSLRGGKMINIDAKDGKYLISCAYSHNWFPDGMPSRRWDPRRKLWLAPVVRLNTEYSKNCTVPGLI